MDKVDLLINKLKEKITHIFKEETSGHDIEHLERVLKYAMYLQSKEGGDLIVVSIASYIHDIHRILSNQKSVYISPAESLPVVSKLIEDLDIEDFQKKKILSAVEHHEDYNFNRHSKNKHEIELNIVQDADNLDAIGAVGLVRAIKYGLKNNRQMFDKNIPLYQNDYKEGMQDISTIHHIYNKLIRLGLSMNTKTAQKMSKQKIKFLRNFLKLYISEVS